MGPWDVDRFLTQLEQASLVFLESDTAVDMVVWDSID